MGYGNETSQQPPRDHEPKSTVLRNLIPIWYATLEEPGPGIKSLKAVMIAGWPSPGVWKHPDVPKGTVVKALIPHQDKKKGLAKSL